MKQFLKCLTIVALVAVTVSPTTAATKPASPHTRKSVKLPVLATSTPAVIAPAPVAPAMVYPTGCANYLPLVQQYNWNVQVAMAIMQTESQCNPNPPSNAAINYDGVSDFGLFQLHGIPITDPAANVAYAYYHKYVPADGFTPWNTYTSGRYLQYLR